MTIELTRITLENLGRHENNECGDLVMESEEGFIASWRPAAYSVVEGERLGSPNQVHTYQLESGVLRSLIRTAYDAGKRDQRTQTARQLKKIFGL